MYQHLQRQGAIFALAFLVIPVLSKSVAAETSCDVRVRLNRSDGSEPGTIFHEVKTVPEDSTGADRFALYAWDHYRLEASIAISVALKGEVLSIVFRDTQTGVSVGSSTPLSNQQSRFVIADPRRGERSVETMCSINR